MNPRLQLVEVIPYTIEDFLQDVINEFHYLRSQAILTAFPPGYGPVKINLKSETDPYTASALAQITKPAGHLRLLPIEDPWGISGKRSSDRKISSGRTNGKHTDKPPSKKSRRRKRKGKKKNYSNFTSSGGRDDDNKNKSNFGKRKSKRRKSKGKWNKKYNVGKKQFKNIKKNLKKHFESRYKNKYSKGNSRKGSSRQSSSNTLNFKNRKQVYHCNICKAKGKIATHNIKDCPDYDPLHYTKHPEKSKFNKRKTGHNYMFGDQQDDNVELKDDEQPEVQIEHGSEPERTDDELVSGSEVVEEGEGNKPVDEPQQEEKDDQKDEAPHQEEVEDDDVSDDSSSSSSSSS